MGAKAGRTTGIACSEDSLPVIREVSKQSVAAPWTDGHVDPAAVPPLYGCHRRKATRGCRR